LIRRASDILRACVKMPAMFLKPVARASIALSFPRAARKKSKAWRHRLVIAIDSTIVKVRRQEPKF